MGSMILDPVHAHGIPVTDTFQKRLEIAFELPEDIAPVGKPAFRAFRDGRAPVGQRQAVPLRPKTNRAGNHHLVGVRFKLRVHGNLKINLVPPCLGQRRERKRREDFLGRYRMLQRREYLDFSDLNSDLHFLSFLFFYFFKAPLFSNSFTAPWSSPNL